MGNKPSFETQPQHVNLAFANKYVGYKSSKMQVSLETVWADVLQMEEKELLTADDSTKMKDPGYPISLTIDRIEGTMSVEGLWEFRKHRPQFKVQKGNLESVRVLQINIANSTTQGDDVGQTNNTVEMEELKKEVMDGLRMNRFAQPEELLLPDLESNNLQEATAEEEWLLREQANLNKRYIYAISLKTILIENNIINLRAKKKVNKLVDLIIKTETLEINRMEL